MLGEYRFVSEWIVPGPSSEEVYEAVGDTHSYPHWWGDVWLEVEGGEGRPGRGAGHGFWRRAKVERR